MLVGLIDPVLFEIGQLNRVRQEKLANWNLLRHFDNALLSEESIELVDHDTVFVEISDLHDQLLHQFSRLEVLGFDMPCAPLMGVAVIARLDEEARSQGGRPRVTTHFISNKQVEGVLGFWGSRRLLSAR